MSHLATQEGESCDRHNVTPLELASKEMPGSPRYR